MSKLFDKNKLTTEQQSRWDWAVLKYKEIREKNTVNAFETMCDDENLNLLEELNTNKEFQGVATFDFVDEKSALFARLLNGKNPFIFPPPCAYSYPWYEVIEEQGPWSLSLEAKDLEEILWENLTGEQQVLIEQTPWKVIEQISEKEIKVTFGKWEDLDFQWVLKKVKKSCKETKSYIYCNHNPEINRITTYEDLKNEQKYQITKEFDKIKLVLDEKYKENYKKSLYEKYGNTSVSENIFKAELELSEELLNDRRKLRLSDYPTVAEIEELISKKIKNYFNSGYSKDENGNLFVEVWSLEKIKGHVSNNIYMTV